MAFLKILLLTTNLYCFFINLITLNCLPQKQPLEMFYKERVPENFAEFAGKDLCQILFFNQVARQLYLKKRLWHRWCPVNFAKFLWKTFSYRTSRVVASVILLSWLWNYIESQQQKNKVRFVESFSGEVVGVPLKQVGSSDFCWLWVIFFGFKWFDVLVVTRISQHKEELFLYFTHERTWLTQVIRYF